MTDEFKSSEHMPLLDLNVDGFRVYVFLCAAFFSLLD